MLDHCRIKSKEFDDVENPKEQKTGENKFPRHDKWNKTKRDELAHHVTMKYTPHLTFHLDDSIKRGARVIEILQEIETPRSNPE